MITLEHGAGGRKTQELVEKLIAPLFSYRNYNDVGLDSFEDASAIKVGKTHVVFTSDSYVVSPIFFKGGDIGKLAACGTINDLAVMGAKPIAMHMNLILEEGFPKEDLRKVMKSMAAVCKKEKVHLLGGDTKVVERGKADKISIGAFGIGIASRLVRNAGLKAGDAIIVSGTIGEHEMAIFSEREKLDFQGNFSSDCAALYGMIGKAKKAGKITSMKDITRGGLSGALNEMAKKSKVSIHINEEEIPVREAVKNACEIFGFDILNLACEGRAVMGVRARDAQGVLKALRKTREGKLARIIGRATPGDGEVILNTKMGGRKLVLVPTGSVLPRIC
jgi:hydrogenase expression/formation protein HypE